MNSWPQWKARYREEIYHEQGFEEVFVDKVLSKLNNVEPSDVLPQFHFVDDKRKNRYIDFMIINQEKGYLLPIELDGAQKDTNHAKWNDFLSRQNALITRFNTVLRFTNLQMFNQPYDVIKQINSALEKQANAKTQQETTTDNTVVAQYDKPSTQPEQPPVVAKETKNHFSPLTAGAYFVFILMFAAVLFYTSKQDEGTTASEIQPHRQSEQHTGTTAQNNTQLLANNSKNAIPAKEANQHIGEKRTVCGYVAGVKPFSLGTYINFTQPYPNNSMTAVIFDSDLPNVANNANELYQTSGKQLCIEGVIETYRGTAQIKVRAAEQLLRP